MARHKDAIWNLPGENSYPEIQTALLMDIRDELKELNLETKRVRSRLDVLQCHNFLAVPKVLRDIRRNTAKKRRVKTTVNPK